MVACNVILGVTFKNSFKKTTMGPQGISDYLIASCVLFINVGQRVCDYFDFIKVKS